MELLIFSVFCRNGLPSIDFLEFCNSEVFIDWGKFLESSLCFWFNQNVLIYLNLFLVQYIIRKNYKKGRRSDQS